MARVIKEDILRCDDCNDIIEFCDICFSDFSERESIYCYCGGGEHLCMTCREKCRKSK